MRASDSKELTIVALILVATSIKSVLFAEEAGVERPAAVVDHESPSHLAEVTWLLLETINQQQDAARKRSNSE